MPAQLVTGEWLPLEAPVPNYSEPATAYLRPLEFLELIYLFGGLMPAKRLEIRYV